MDMHSTEARASRPWPEGRAAGVPNDTAWVNVERTLAYLGAAARFAVHIDGREVASLVNGEGGRFPVRPGPHEVFVQSGRYRSETVRLDLAPGEQAEVVCATKGVKNPVFKAAKWAFLGGSGLVLVSQAIPTTKAWVHDHPYHPALAAAISVMVILLAVNLVAMVIEIRRSLSRKPGDFLGLARRPPGPEAPGRLGTP